MKAMRTAAAVAFAGILTAGMITFATAGPLPTNVANDKRP